MSKITAWQESLGDGLRRDHSTACISSKDRKPQRECDCPLTFWRTVAKGRRIRDRIDGSTVTIKQAKAEKTRRAAEDRDQRAQPQAVHHELWSTPDEVAPILREHFRQTMAERTDLRPSTRHDYETTYRLVIDPQLGAMPVDRITGLHAKQMHLAALAARGHTRRVEKALPLLSRLVRAWTGPRGLRNPIPDFVPPPMQRNTYTSADRAITLSTYDGLREGLPYASANRIILRLVTEAMLRCGEVGALRRDDIDLDNRSIRVDEAVWPKTKSYVGGPKGKVRLVKNVKPRFVAINEDFRDEFAAYLAATWTAETEPTDFILPGRGQRGIYPKPRKGTVPMAGTSVSRRVKEMVLAADLVDDDGKPLTSAHGLRATGISIVNDHAGIDVASRMARHSRTSTTEQSYANRTDIEPQRKGAAAFSRGSDHPSPGF